MATTLELPMADHGYKTMSIRIGVEALEAARIAAAYKGMTVMDYVTQVLLDQANRDIEAGHQARASGGRPPEGAPRGRKPKGGE